MKQLPPLPSGGRFERLGQRAPGLGAPVEALGGRRRVARKQALIVGELGRVDFAAQDLEPGAEIGQPLEIRPQEQPIFFGGSLRQAIGNR